MEIDHLVHTVDELRTQELTQRFHDALFSLIASRLIKAYRTGSLIRTGIGGHNDDGIFKVYHPTLGIGNPSVVQNLQ